MEGRVSKPRHLSDEREDVPCACCRSGEEQDGTVKTEAERCGVSGVSVGLERLSATIRTHRVEVTRRERSSEPQDLVQALLDGGQLVGLSEE